ncbi:hypothetical protein VaNZ11_012939 [Volvox africanus]|uniref:Uncharacterized protein n=1 Tax=Volvox africanus TaxID=51714 RepID=A0ABQ5SH30_9CHLO|nr:hypothetical protein VaNZ11_012939 [Volvox africanus]
MDSVRMGAFPVSQCISDGERNGANLRAQPPVLSESPNIGATVVTKGKDHRNLVAPARLMGLQQMGPLPQRQQQYLHQQQRQLRDGVPAAAAVQGAWAVEYGRKASTTSSPQSVRKGSSIEITGKGSWGCRDGGDGIGDGARGPDSSKTVADWGLMRRAMPLQRLGQVVSRAAVSWETGWQPHQQANNQTETQTCHMGETTVPPALGISAVVLQPGLSAREIFRAGSELRRPWVVQEIVAVKRQQEEAERRRERHEAAAAAAVRSLLLAEAAMGARERAAAAKKRAAMRQARCTGVKSWHTRERAKAAREAGERLKVLKSNNYSAYLLLASRAKDSRLRELLQRTDAIMAALTEQLEHHKAATAAAEGLTGTAVAAQASEPGLMLGMTVPVSGRADTARGDIHNPIRTPPATHDSNRVSAVETLGGSREAGGAGEKEAEAAGIAAVAAAAVAAAAAAAVGSRSSKMGSAAAAATTAASAALLLSASADCTADSITAAMISRQQRYYEAVHGTREAISAPAMLSSSGCQLRPYQLDGLRFLASLFVNRMNGILADEMGLGKTLQAISLLAHLAESGRSRGPHLILAPKAVLTNWVGEMQRWAPGLEALCYDGTQQERKALRGQLLAAAAAAVGAAAGSGAAGYRPLVVVTHYDVAIRDKGLMKKLSWQVLVVDEGHRLKNHRSALFSVLSGLRPACRLLLSGTPLQNNLSELWALLNFLMPHVFSCQQDFDDWFAAPFKGSADREDLELGEEERLLVINRLHQVLRPFLLRRTKREVASELPEKRRHVIRCPMSAWQAELYRQISQRGLVAASGKARSLVNLSMHLRKACIHPYLLEEERAVPGLPLGRGIPGRAPGQEPQLGAGGAAPAVAPVPAPGGAGAADRLRQSPDAGPQAVFAAPDAAAEELIRSSGKLALLDSVLPKLAATGHRVLLFSQMTRALDLVEELLELRGHPYLRLDGSTRTEERPRLLAAFNDPASPHLVFLLSTRAGGMGLNLQSADTVIMLDSDWNPAMDQQAEDRAHRLGQTRSVLVLVLVSSGTLEEVILDRAQNKRGMGEAVIGAGLFNERATQAERQQALQALLGQGSGVLMEGSAPPHTTQEINKMLARSDEELQMFEEFDASRQNDAVRAAAAAGYSTPLPPLMGEDELPDRVRARESTFGDSDSNDGGANGDQENADKAAICTGRGGEEGRGLLPRRTRRRRVASTGSNGSRQSYADLLDDSAFKQLLRAGDGTSNGSFSSDTSSSSNSRNSSSDEDSVLFRCRRVRSCARRWAGARSGRAVVDGGDVGCDSDSGTDSDNDENDSEEIEDSSGPRSSKVRVRRPRQQPLQTWRLSEDESSSELSEENEDEEAEGDKPQQQNEQQEVDVRESRKQKGVVQPNSPKAGQVQHCDPQQQKGEEEEEGIEEVRTVRNMSGKCSSNGAQRDRKRTRAGDEEELRARGKGLRPRRLRQWHGSSMVVDDSSKGCVEPRSVAAAAAPERLAEVASQHDGSERFMQLRTRLQQDAPGALAAPLVDTAVAAQVHEGSTTDAAGLGQASGTQIPNGCGGSSDVKSGASSEPSNENGNVYIHTGLGRQEKICRDRSVPQFRQPQHGSRQRHVARPGSACVHNEGKEQRDAAVEGLSASGINGPESAQASGSGRRLRSGRVTGS